MDSRYYEGILQLRNPSPEAEEFVMKELKLNHVSVAKVVKHRNGQDLYVSSNRFVIRLARQLRERFGSVNKLSRKIEI